MAYDPLNDKEFDAIKSRIDGAGDEDATEQLAADIGARRDAAEHPIRRFALNAPKNIGVGAWKALVNTVDTLSDAGGEVAKGTVEKVTGAKVPQQMTPSLSEQFPEFMDSMRNFTSAWERNDTMSDDVAQGIAQFTIPFLGWMKVAGGVGGLTKTAALSKAVGVETATAGSAFAPQEGRVADLLEMGRESETRFGTLLRKIAPDESLMNQYIEYMTNRDGEGVWEGRWKNAVDAAVSSAAVGALLKTAAGTYKFGKFALEDAGVSSFGPKNQKGMVAFHGTPHDFEAFDISKLGSGEGNQSFGHGLYFAENPKVGKQYQAKLGKLEPGEYERAKKWIKQKSGKDPDAEWGYTSPRDYIRLAESMGFEAKTSGKLYTVDIDDDAVAKMLDYDKVLSEQPGVLEKIPAADRQKLVDMLDDYGQSPDLEEYTGNQLQQLIGRAIEEDYFGDFMPRDGLFDGNRKKYAAEYLAAHDIPGIRYLDGTSRNKGDGTRNIVLFDDKLVKITKKE